MYINQTTTMNCSFVDGKELSVGATSQKPWHTKKRLVKRKVSLVINIKYSYTLATYLPIQLGIDYSYFNILAIADGCLRHVK